MKVLITLTADDVDEDTFRGISGVGLRQLIRDALGEYCSARGLEGLPTAHGDGVETYVATRYASMQGHFRSAKLKEVRAKLALAMELLRHEPNIEWTSK